MFQPFITRVLSRDDYWKHEMEKKKEQLKAAILTWCYNNGKTNYGQILQCYAMQTVMRRLGYDTKVIRYRKRDSGERLDLEGKHSLFVGLYELWYRLKRVEQKADIRILRFIQFIRKNISLSEQCYTEKEVEEECRDCGVLVCGSDQIWNPLWFEDVYALNFGSASQKRIAYAPSGALIDNGRNGGIYRELGKQLERFDLVTVREKRSVEILKKYTSKEIVDVVDPTLLLSEKDWNRIASRRKIKEPYIFCYSMGRLRSHKVLLRHILKKYDARKVLFLTADFIKKEDALETGGYFYPVGNAGPAEFLALIRDARAVCTDSFHGLALSIVYRKQFYILGRDHPDAYEGANRIRQENLLEKAGIGGERYIRCVKELEELEEVDYGKVRVRLEECRAEAEMLLRNALSL